VFKVKKEKSHTGEGGGESLAKNAGYKGRVWGNTSARPRAKWDLEDTVRLSKLTKTNILYAKKGGITSLGQSRRKDEKTESVLCF